MEWSEIVGGNVRRLRERKRLSQEQLAHDAGINLSTLTKLERGVGNPTLSTIVQIAEQLGVNPGKLFQE